MYIDTLGLYAFIAGYIWIPILIVVGIIMKITKSD